MNTPPRAIRARTPPTPGPASDSPRRSTRSSAQRNPYSSFNGRRSPRPALALNVTPPATVKRARFAHPPIHLSSPPSSPVSPVKRQPQHRTPHKQASTPRKAANESRFDSAQSLAPANIDPITMLPTPSKTPKKRGATTITPRILRFQPDDPNDVMPSARKIRKQGLRRHAGTAGFELYEDDADMRQDDAIQIFTDANARVPELDESEDNPFVGRRRTEERAQRRRSNKSAEEVERDRLMDEAVKRNEGVTYVFRGKKIFRKFEDVDREEGASSVATDLSGTLEQRRLKRQAGAAAQRPLTRSTIKPRLLFPSEEQQAERDRRAQEVDEEAVTDIEMPNAGSPVKAKTPKHDVTPVQARFQASTPPATNRATRSKGKEAMQETAGRSPLEEEGGVMPAIVCDSQSAAVSDAGLERKARSPFDTWQRTKRATGKKRAGDDAELASGGGKRVKTGLVESVP